jgi:interleukin-1 receptor-associated kinase 1/coatomer subunit beta'
MDDISIGLSKLERILDGKKRPDKLNLLVLSHITEKFSDERKIGEGGSGHVYKVKSISKQNPALLFPQRRSY